MEYRSQRKLEIQTKRLNRNEYRITALKDLNGLEPYEVANDITYCFEHEKMIFQKCIEDCALEILEKYKIKIGNRESDQEIAKAFEELKEKYKRKIVIHDLNADKLVCDENNLITMICSVEVVKL